MVELMSEDPSAEGAWVRLPAAEQRPLASRWQGEARGDTRLLPAAEQRPLASRWQGEAKGANAPIPTKLPFDFGRGSDGDRRGASAHSALHYRFGHIDFILLFAGVRNSHKSIVPHKEESINPKTSPAPVIPQGSHQSTALHVLRSCRLAQAQSARQAHRARLPSS